MRNRRRITYRPSRAGAILGAVAGALFVVIGTVVVIPNFGAFGVIWTLLAAAITVYNVYMAFGGKYIGPEISIEDDSPEQPQAPDRADVETRLMRLESLHTRGLVTDEEYEHKREEILKQL